MINSDILVLEKNSSNSCECNIRTYCSTFDLIKTSSGSLEPFIKIYKISNQKFDTRFFKY